MTTKTTKRNYAEFFALLRKSPGAEKESVISDFTDGRTSSLHELSDAEYRGLCASLRKATQGIPDQPPAIDPKRDAMRKGIIAIFHQMHYANAAAAAKEWAEKMGAGGVKKSFNRYTAQELMKLLAKAEWALRDYQDNIRKHMPRSVDMSQPQREAQRDK